MTAKGLNRAGGRPGSEPNCSASRNDGLLEQFGAAFEVQLLFQVFAIGFDGLDAQAKFAGDLAGGETVANQLEDLQFPVAQSFNRKSRRGSLALDQVTEQTRLDRIADNHFSLENTTNRIHDLNGWAPVS